MAVRLETPFPAEALSEALYWGRFFSEEWRQDTPPDVIHSSTLSEDGTPQWTAAFARWIGNAAPDSEQRHRTTVVMRRLRRDAVRAYEVLWRTMILGESIDDTTEWLNERAARNNIPLPDGRDVHYRPKDTVALMISGIEYARAYW